MDEQEAWRALGELGLVARLAGKGMESFVYDVGEGQLAKVWLARRPPEVRLLRSFYTALRAQPLPYATPSMTEVLATGSGHAVSLEERLPGVPLKTLLEGRPHDNGLRAAGMGAMVAVATALGRLDTVAQARELPLLGEPSPWQPGATWGTVLGTLVARRAERYRNSLSHAVPRLESIVESVVALLAAQPLPRLGVVHGDLCAENVLVDPTTVAPTALIDFGFLTTCGDPLFDATIATLVYDMYSPRAHEARRHLHALYLQAYGRPFTDAYPLYKAAYALATSNAYSEEGQDGHFAWCIDILNDAETAALVGEI